MSRALPVIIVLLVGCQLGPHPKPLEGITKLEPYAMTAHVLVWVEDQNEDPVVDAQHYSAIELAADHFELPWNLITLGVRTFSFPVVALTFLALHPHQSGQASVEQAENWLNAWFPFRFAGPDPTSN